LKGQIGRPDSFGFASLRAPEIDQSTRAGGRSWRRGFRCTRESICCLPIDLFQPGHKHRSRKILARNGTLT